MKIEYHHDIAAPAEFVFARLTDIERHERQALRNGIEIVRLASPDGSKQGAAWDLAFKYRGRQRKLRAEMTDLVPPRRLKVNAVTGGLHINAVVALVALSPTLTRVNVDVNLVPQSMTARLLVQSLKLARGNVTARLERRLADQGAEIATAWARRRD